MALTNGDLLAISNLLDKKLDARLTPMEERLKRIEVDLLENNVIPRLNTDILKAVVAEHSEKLRKIS